MFKVSMWNDYSSEFKIINENNRKSESSESRNDLTCEIIPAKFKIYL